MGADGFVGIQTFPPSTMVDNGCSREKRSRNEKREEGPNIRGRVQNQSGGCYKELGLKWYRFRGVKMNFSDFY